MNRLRDVLWLGDTLDQLGNEALDILVDDETADLLHGAVSHLLDLGLGVPHRLGDDGDKIWNAEGELCGRGFNERLDTAEAGDLLLPLLGGEDRVDDRREDGLDSIGVDGLDDAQRSLLGGVLDGNHLVADGCEN